LYTIHYSESKTPPFSHIFKINRKKQTNVVVVVVVGVAVVVVVVVVVAVVVGRGGVGSTSTFARVQCNQRALVQRGWCPLNYALLTNETVLRTKTDENGKLIIENQGKVITQCMSLNLDEGTSAELFDKLIGHAN
jgi:hypothetical protein